MDKTRHVGKVAIVTGAGSGIGRATTLRLAQEGAAVFGCDVNAGGLDETRAALEQAGVSATLIVAERL